MATSIKELQSRRENLAKEIAQLLVLRAWSHKKELFDGDIAMFNLRLQAVDAELKERTGWSASVTQ